MSAETATAVPRPPARTASAPVLTGAQAVVRSLELLGVTDVFGLPGGAILPVYDPLMDSHRAAAHPGAPRAGRRPRRRGLRRGIEQDRRRHRDVRSRCDQPRHRDRRRLHGLGADRLHHRSGLLEPDGDGCLPGGRHRRHHDADHEALVPREARRGHPRRDRRGVRDRRHRSPRPRARRHHEGRPAGRGAVHLAAEDRPAGLPPGDQGARQADPGRGAAARRGQEARAVRRRRRHPLAGVGRAARPRRDDRRAVVTTLMARGAFPDSHQQHLGMPGMHGTVPAVLALQEADLLDLARRPLRRPRHRQGGAVRPERQGRARRHRPGRDRQDPRRRGADRGRPQGRARRPRGARSASRPAARSPTSTSGGRSSTGCATSSRSATRSRPTA